MITQSKSPFTYLLAVFACFGMLLLQSCAKHSPKPFMKIPTTGITKNNITVSALELTKEDSVHYFNSDITTKNGWFTSYPGYQAIQLSIKNNSQNSCILDANNINTSIANYEQVSEKLHSQNKHNLPLMFILSPLLVFLPCYIANNSLRTELIADLKGRTINPDTIATIGAHNSLNKFLFIPKDVSVSLLSLALTNEQNGEKTVFDIDLE